MVFLWHNSLKYLQSINIDNAVEYIYGQMKLLYEKIEELLLEKFNL